MRDTWLFIQDARRGWGGLGDYGASKYSADNPPHGAVISYYLPEALESRKVTRRKAEQERAEAGEDNLYPNWEALRREDREETPSLTLTVRDSEGAVVRRIEAPTEKGFHRVAWDMRYPAPDPISLEPPGWMAPWFSPPRGPLALPGQYSVTLSKRVEGAWEDLTDAETVQIKPLFEDGLVTGDRAALLEFQQQAASLYRAISGAGEAAVEIQSRIDHLTAAIRETPGTTETDAQAVRALRGRMQDIELQLNGDQTITSRNEAAPMSIAARVGNIVDGMWDSQSGVTGTFRDSYAIADAQFTGLVADLKAVANDLDGLETRLEAEGAPWTPGRIPDWPSE
jgi:hypothetical protein